MGALEFALLGSSILLAGGLFALSTGAYLRSRERRVLVPAGVSLALLLRGVIVAAEPLLRLGLRPDLTFLVDLAILLALLFHTLLRRPRVPDDKRAGA